MTQIYFGDRQFALTLADDMLTISESGVFRASVRVEPLVADPEPDADEIAAMILDDLVAIQP